MGGTSGDLYGVWGSSGNDVFAVGSVGKILHYNGSNWSAMDSGVTKSLNDVWGSSSNDVFAVGEDGTILHYNGSNWTPMDSGTSYDLQGVWGSSGNDVFAVGSNGTILHYGNSTVPKATTLAVSSITTKTASSGGNVTSEGGGPVTSRGVCWATSINPTLANSHTTDGAGIGIFTSTITGLVDDITYHVRAYAVNSFGATYGCDRTFTTLFSSSAYVNKNDGTCGGKSPCYTSIQAAINAAATGSNIRIAQGTYTESITLSTSKSLTLKGGWNSSFTAQTPNTTVIKAPKAPQGSLTLQMVTIRP